MNDPAIVVIIILLPVVSSLLVFETNPYHALITRAILGAIAALVYAVLGAADVALTEALVGTMLAITLYVIAVRSSMVMRLGISHSLTLEQQADVEKLIEQLKKTLDQYYLRLEIVEYDNLSLLKQALNNKAVHAISLPTLTSDPSFSSPCHTAVRIQRLFEILKPCLLPAVSSLSYLTICETEEVKH